MIEQKRKELLQLYQLWETEFKETCPQQRTSDYSFPYYMQIPDDWYGSKYRVMIVGEEGAGYNKPFDMPITEAQQFNKDHLMRQMDRDNKICSRLFRRGQKQRLDFYRLSVCGQNISEQSARSLVI